MKQLTIGRNNACDIIIPDTSDLVSRKQAVLSFSFWGKMVLYDTSNNGTYVNGQRLDNGKGIQVTRTDNVNFARIADLDWDEVKDPYRKSKITLVISILAILVVSVLLLLWIPQLTKDDNPVPVNTEVISEKGETVTSIKPQVVEKQSNQLPTKKSKKKNNIKKEKPVIPKDDTNKDVNDKSPIVY